MIRYYLSITALFLSAISFSQGVAIGAGSAVPDASAMLDVQSNTKGFLVPRMTTTERNAIAAPATGLLIYQSDNTAGFYYNSGTPGVPVWAPLLASGWGLAGNSGTVAGTHFIGTTDNITVLFKTNNTERMRITDNGQIIINSANRQSTQDAFEVIGAGLPNATTSFSYPINGYSANSYCGVYGSNNGSGQGVLGQGSGAGTGVSGFASGTGIGISGFAFNNFGSQGETSNASYAGVRGLNTNGNGTGILGSGNNTTTITLNSVGSGLAANARYTGTYSLATDAASGIGVVGLGNGITTFNNIGSGAGLLGQGENFGLTAYASTASSAVTNNKWAGYFDYLPSGNGFAYVGGRAGGTDYAILSNGVKSTMVKDAQNRNRIMYCTEAPEVLFQDYGSSQLINGRVHVTIDPVLARNIYTSADKPLKVFIQLEGDCKGVYVTNKTASGFDVIELQNGTSNTPFSYQLVANRADAKDENGKVVSGYANTRFPVGPERMRGTAAPTTVHHSPCLQIPVKCKTHEGISQ
jgi:hypothetical protein